MASCAPQPLSLYIGTYGSHYYEATFSDGSLALGRAVDAANPTFLCVGKDALYSVSGMPERPGAYSFLPDGTNSFIDCPGVSPCHITELADGSHIATAEYSSGSLSVYDTEAGRITGIAEHLTFSPASHIHQLRYIPGTSWLLATDLGDDCIHVFAHGASVPLEEIMTLRDGFAEGDGPRHMEFNPEKKMLYCICELSDNLQVFRYEFHDDMPSFRHLQTFKANPVDAGGSADIHLSPDGKFLYTSHRLANDGIAAFKVLDDGTVEPAGYFNCGAHPRNFFITPDGEYMLVACRDTHAVEVYAIDRESGALSKVSETSFGEDKPCCIIEAH